MSGYKQAIVLRQDLDMSTGKMVAQACHASLKAYRNSSEEEMSGWTSGGEKKVVLAANEEQIMERKRRADRKDITAALVKDAGRTELDPGTVTALGVGPDSENKIDGITGDLGLVE
ncbi:MAG: peptidyl-tRNA hydrolase Pth2 [Candidatus Nanohaloarchaea archaeon]